MPKTTAAVLATVLLFISLNTCTVNTVSIPIEKIVYHIVKSTRSGYTQRKVDCIMKFSHKYSDEKVFISPIMLANIGDAESDHRHYLINKNSGCFGEYQISTNHWNHLLWYVDNGKLGKHIERKKVVNTWRYFLRIGYNTEAACIILRDYKIRYKTWENALIVFGGWRTAYGRRYPGKKYKYLSNVFSLPSLDNIK